jgi:hypothetical protein
VLLPAIRKSADSKFVRNPSQTKTQAHNPSLGHPPPLYTFGETSAGVLLPAIPMPTHRNSTGRRHPPSRKRLVNCLTF